MANAKEAEHEMTEQLQKAVEQGARGNVPSVPQEKVLGPNPVTPQAGDPGHTGGAS